MLDLFDVPVEMYPVKMFTIIKIETVSQLLPHISLASIIEHSFCRPHFCYSNLLILVMPPLAVSHISLVSVGNCSFFFKRLSAPHHLSSIGPTRLSNPGHAVCKASVSRTESQKLAQIDFKQLNERLYYSVK